MIIPHKSFSVTDNVKVLKLKNNLSNNILLFIFSIWKKGIPSLGYTRHWKYAKDTPINLPIKNNEIDFDFMESFIAELEAYLKTTGLSSYELTQEEKDALNNFDSIQWKEFSIIDIFDIYNTKNILKSQIIPNSGRDPYLTASEFNNSVHTYISFDKSKIEKGDCIFIGGKTLVITYQSKDFYSNDSHNLVLYFKDNEIKNKKVSLAFIASLKKALSSKYSWGNSISKSKIQKDILMLPIHNNKIDFEYIEILISAIQKLVIKDVVEYTDKKIKATKEVVSNKTR